MKTLLEILLTPNPDVTKILLLPGTIFEFIFTIQISILILDKHISKNRRLICFLIFGTYYVLSVFLFNEYITSILITTPI